MKRKKNFTRTRVLRVLLAGRLEKTRSGDVAEYLGMSNSTLRRHLHREGTSYQELLNAVRHHVCERTLARRWVPGKCLAADLGFSEPNSFYRAFNRWTGKTFTEYKKECRGGSAPAP